MTLALRWLRRLALTIIGLYAAVLIGMTLFQRQLLYVPFDGPTTPQAAGITDARVATFTSADGLEIPYWRKDPAPGFPMVVHFHGNGGGIHTSASRLADLAARGFGIAALSYRGYPATPGTPSQAAITADALALFDLLAREGYSGDRLAVYGWSLGSGVAMQALRGRSARAIVLETPFTAAVDVAAERYPLLPVAWLMQDQWRSRDRVGDVAAPILVLHGTADWIVPFEQGERLFRLLPEPKQFRRYDGAGHLNLTDYGSIDVMARFLLEGKLEGLR